MDFFAKMLTALTAWGDDATDENAEALSSLFVDPVEGDFVGLEASSDDLISTIESLGSFADSGIDGAVIVNLSAFTVALDDHLTGVLAAEKAAKDAADSARLAFAKIREKLAANRAKPEVEAKPESASAASIETSATEAEVADDAPAAPILDPDLNPVDAPTTASGPTWTLLTDAGAIGDAGSSVDGPAFPSALAEGLAHLYSVRKGARGERASVITLDRPTPVKLTPTDLSSPAKTSLALQRILAPTSITAKPMNASGVCDFERIVTTQTLPLPNWQDVGIDEWGIPTIGIEAGIGDGMSIKYRKPILDSVPDSYVWADPAGAGTTYADQAANANSYPWVQGDDDKGCGLLPCGVEANCDIVADPICVSYEVEQQRFNPDNFQVSFGAFQVAMARRKSRQIFERISGMSDVRSAPTQGDVGMLAYWLTVLSAYRTRMVSEHRLPEGLNWNVSAPAWVAAALQNDLLWTKGWDQPAVTRQQIISAFAARGFTLRFRREGAPGDNTEITAGAPGSAIEMLPQDATVIVYHDGAIFNLGGGSLTIGTVVDSALLRSNRREIWEESWIGTCLFGFQPVQMVLGACPNGHNQIERLSADCATVSLT